MTVQIIGFKLTVDQIEKIDDLLLKNLYFSRSEILRSAIHSYLSKDSSSIIPLLPDLAEVSGSGKDIITAKIPKVILRFMDSLVTKHQYKSRSQFIRDAVDNFLHEREFLHQLVS